MIQNYELQNIVKEKIYNKNSSHFFSLFPFIKYQQQFNNNHNLHPITSRLLYSQNYIQTNSSKNNFNFHTEYNIENNFKNTPIKNNQNNQEDNKEDNQNNQEDNKEDNQNNQEDNKEDNKEDNQEDNEVENYNEYNKKNNPLKIENIFNINDVLNDVPISPIKVFEPEENNLNKDLEEWIFLK